MAHQSIQACGFVLLDGTAASSPGPSWALVVAVWSRRAASRSAYRAMGEGARPGTRPAQAADAEPAPVSAADKLHASLMRGVPVNGGAGDE